MMVFVRKTDAIDVPQQLENTVTRTGVVRYYEKWIEEFIEEKTDVLCGVFDKDSISVHGETRLAAVYGVSVIAEQEEHPI